MKGKLFPLILLLLILLLPSCTKDDSPVGLFSTLGAEVWSPSTGCAVTLSGEMVASLRAEGESVRDLMEYLFPSSVLYETGESEWRERERIISALVAVTGTERVDVAYHVERKSLSSSSYRESMAAVSGEYEGKLLSLISKRKEWRIYDATIAVPLSGERERMRTFLKSWINTIL